jgi:hypothetical protein
MIVGEGCSLALSRFEARPAPQEAFSGWVGALKSA